MYLYNSMHILIIIYIYIYILIIISKQTRYIPIDTTLYSLEYSHVFPPEFRGGGMKSNIRICQAPAGWGGSWWRGRPCPSVMLVCKPMVYRYFVQWWPNRNPMLFIVSFVNGNWQTLMGLWYYKPTTVFRKGHRSIRIINTIPQTQ